MLAKFFLILFLFFFSLTKTAIKLEGAIRLPKIFAHVKKRYRAHLGTKFHLNASINGWVINNYPQKILPIPYVVMPTGKQLTLIS